MPNKSIDVVFLVDATGSMFEAIDGLKASIKNFFVYLTDTERNAKSFQDWRAKIVGFRDVEADEEWIVNNPFVTTREEVEEQLDALEAKGGGDEPEDLLDALLVVANMDSPAERGGTADGFQWRHRRDAARAIVAFTDATYHPNAKLPFNNNAAFDDVARVLDSQRVILELVTPVTPFDDSVDPNVFRAMHEDLGSANRAEYLPLTNRQGSPMSFQDIPKNLDAFNQFMEQLGKSISESIDPVAL